ncbi:MAG: hypothetical protein HYZ28_11290 [Myxococcales bacterium]|nr:hypothetical protein [Myxococcales bacterium]
MEGRKISGLASWAICLCALAGGCRSDVDPDKGRFSCGSDADCGPGWECRPQASGGGLCFLKGACGEESCDGKDDDCDGLTDESFATEGQACTTALPGVCRAGAFACVDGAVTCRPLTPAGPEACDSRDNDCDGSADEDFDLATDARHCGGCNRPCLAGALCVLSNCREASCSDRADNDGDLAVDCDDDDCLGAACESADASVNCGLAFPEADAGGADGGADSGTDGGADGGDPDAGDDAGAPDAGDADAGPDGGADSGTDGGELDGGPLDAGPAPGDGGVFDGGDGGPGDAGAPVRACVPRESACGNGSDDDGDGQADCADPDCDGKTCANGMSCAGLVCPPAG